ncbi:hypothetical protein DIPPA_27127 [Diplonema papillatum]|nr:hypothetical protein DIPPA_27127 [Diplonema papillatum]
MAEETCDEPSNPLLCADAHWQSCFGLGDPSLANPDASTVWLESYIQLCKDHPVVTAAAEAGSLVRDWNGEYQNLVSGDRLTPEERRIGTQRLVDDFQSAVESIVEALAQQADPLNPDEAAVQTAAKSCQKSRGANGLPVVSFSCGNVVVHMSSATRLPSAAVRHAAYVNSSDQTLNEVSSPLCAHFVCRGRHFLVAAKIPLAPSGDKVDPTAASVQHTLDHLACCFNSSFTSDPSKWLARGSDGRLYMVPAMELLDHRVELSARFGASNNQASLELGIDALATYLVQCADRVSSVACLREHFRAHGVPIRHLGRVMEHVKVSSMPLSCAQKLRSLMVAEMAARALKQAAVIDLETSEGQGLEAVLELCNTD